MILVIAEKSSVGTAIAAVLGADDNKKSYREGNGYVVSWCSGHLCGLARPEYYDPSYKKWDIKALPIIPEKWELEILPENKGQFYVLKKLMYRSDISEIICAADAGREGEVIYRFVHKAASCSKPVMRLWISSVEKSDIQKGFEKLRSDSHYDKLYAAGFARTAADWIVGINLSRLFSEIYGENLTIGRVQTAALNLIVQREEEIKSFTSKKYYTVTLDYKGMTAETERIDDLIYAKKLAENVNTSGQAFIGNVDVQEKTVYPPKLFNLADLQKIADSLFDMTAHQTLTYAQSLYEKGLITYPRTDSNYVNESMRQKILSLFDICADKYNIADLTANADLVINDAKVTDHHALLPTLDIRKPEKLTGLNEGEITLLNLICIQLLCAVSPVHKYEQTTLTLVSSDNEFKLNGVKIIDGGWKDTKKHCYENYLNKSVKLEDKLIPKEAVRGLVLDGVTARCEEHHTTPPKHFRDGTLITAMEKAGEYGIGTQATQTGIIVKLFDRKYVERINSSIIPTEKGVKLISHAPEALKSADLTSEWEKRFEGIEKGTDNAEDFINDIKSFVIGIINEYAPLAAKYDKKNVIGRCPVCGKDVIETPKAYSCDGGKGSCKFAIWKNKSGKNITSDIAKALLENGHTEKISGFKSKSGKTFNAKLYINNGQVDFFFG